MSQLTTLKLRSPQSAKTESICVCDRLGIQISLLFISYVGHSVEAWPLAARNDHMHMVQKHLAEGQTMLCDLEKKGYYFWKK